MTTENLKLWASLEKTDPKHTKDFNRSGFKGTAINGAYILKRLTEAFGPCGQEWRFVLDDERIVPGHTLSNGDRAQLHIVRGHLEYRVKGEWVSTSPQFGQTMLVGENKNGTFTDEEAPKKSITDCIAKCAVQLGIGADIHLGLYDDNKYVNSLKAEFAGEAKVDGGKPEKEPADKTKARKAWLRIRDAVAAAKTAAEVAEIMGRATDDLALIHEVSAPNVEKLWEMAKAMETSLAAKNDDFPDDPLPEE